MKNIPIKPIDKVGFVRYSTFNIRKQESGRQEKGRLLRTGKVQVMTKAAEHLIRSEYRFSRMC